MGEGGAIAPPAVVVNAINDALRSLGVEISETPATPARILDKIIVAEGGANETRSVYLSSRDVH
jgi:carbon-monoxide dehydrogenase large subunit